MSPIIYLIISISLFILILGIKKSETIIEKILLIIGFILVIGIIIKYILLKEGFQSQLTNDEFLTNVEELDSEYEDKKEHYDTLTENVTNKDDDTDKDDKQKQNNTFNPSLVINIDKSNNTDTLTNNNNPKPTTTSSTITTTVPTTSSTTTTTLPTTSSTTPTTVPTTTTTVPTTNESFSDNDDETVDHDEFLKSIYFTNNSTHAPVNGTESELLESIEKKVDAAKKRRKLQSLYYIPGYAYLPPTEWDTPRSRHEMYRCKACPTSNPDTRKLPISIMDPGTPIYALEINGDGRMAMSDDEAPLTAVGSILPKFEYREYADCMSHNQPTTANTTTANTATANTTIANTTTTKNSST